MFPKDIVVIDFEYTNVDVSKAKPMQLGAVLLDKNTLEEKDSWSTYIYADLSDALPESLEVSGIKQETLEGAPSATEVGKMFLEKFGDEIMLSAWVISGDVTMFRYIMEAAGIDHTRFDYHVFDIWAVAFAQLMKEGYEGSIRSEAIFQKFGLPPRGDHDALEDCRHAATVLRKLMIG